MSETIITDLEYVKKFCESKNSKYLEYLSPYNSRFFYELSKK